MKPFRILSLATAAMIAIALPVRAQTAVTEAPQTDVARPGDLHPVSHLVNDRGLHAAQAQFADATAPDDLFALGAVQFLGAFEGIGAAMTTMGAPPVSWIPGLRMPTQPDAAAPPIDHDAFRAALQRLVDDLATAAATLAKIDGRDFGTRVDLAHFWFDLDGDGVRGPDEEIAIAAAEAGLLPAGAAGPSLVVRFDAADAPWLEAYAHLVSGVMEVVLAQDFRAGLAAAQSTAAFEKWRGYEFLDEGSMNQILIALMALRETPDAARMRAALDHLRAVIALNTEVWTLLGREADNDAEWIPNPKQVSALGGATVSAETAQAWRNVLADASDLLEGRRLAPHWRFVNGFNLRRVFEEPRPLDPLMWIPGAGAVPYLEEGPMVDARSWENFTRIVGGDALAYAIWFN